MSMKVTVPMTDTEFALWNALAFERIRFLAATQAAFSTDEVWALLDTLPKPSDPRALGALVKRAQSERLITKSDCSIISTRGISGGRPINIWLSVAKRATIQDACEYIAQRKPRLSASQLAFETITPSEVTV